MMAFFSKQTGTLVNYRQICFLYIWITIYKTGKSIARMNHHNSKIEKGNEETKDDGHWISFSTMFQLHIRNII